SGAKASRSITTHSKKIRAVVSGRRFTGRDPGMAGKSAFSSGSTKQLLASTRAARLSSASRMISSAEFLEGFGEGNDSPILLCIHSPSCTLVPFVVQKFSVTTKDTKLHKGKGTSSEPFRLTDDLAGEHSAVVVCARADFQLAAVGVEDFKFP